MLRRYQQNKYNKSSITKSNLPKLGEKVKIEFSHQNYEIASKLL